ncbi:enoyl-CoA hydratase-related protein [Acidimicrobiia bacterium EGI L10123]|uniref:enoyl-CoA hydratase-related protein n=1 Tax=Salinilacustrithrix flava TaxID=2957203 RepID=UPI003D7C27AA|nr:enoyl-CoA hydratase-related protein [Acidimicrobiia bacterium EGI L10123]
MPALTSTRDGDVVTITLTAPERRNPLSTSTLRELGSALDEAAASDALAVVLASTGSVWSTGHDLKEMSTLDETSLRELFTTCTRVMRTIETMPQPVVARVHALATAAGCQLVASCDLAVAGASARFATPGGKGGLFCHTPMVAVARNVGRKRALEMALSGDEIDAETAADWGLVNQVVPDDELDGAVAELVRRVTRGSRASKALGKQTLYAQMDLTMDQAYDMAIDVMARNAATGDGAEGIAAFAEKRPPRFAR